MSVVKTEVVGGWALVTIDRPEAMNALSGAVLEGLLAAAESLGADPSVRLVAFTGAGDKAFCAGADLKERRGMSEAETRARIDLINTCFTTIERLPKPTLALINGVALGGGLELALACDFRVAVEGAKLGLTEVRLGIMPGAGGTQRLPRVIGVARAKDMIFTGRPIAAQHAVGLGLVQYTVKSVADLRRSGEGFAADLDGTAPISVAQAKAAIDRGLDLDLDAGLAWERTCYDVTLATEDRDEGLRAFAEKRPPSYQGK